MNQLNECNDFILQEKVFEEFEKDALYTVVDETFCGIMQELSPSHNLIHSIYLTMLPTVTIAFISLCVRGKFTMDVIKKALPAIFVMKKKSD